MRNLSELEYLQVQRNHFYNIGDMQAAYAKQQEINNFVPDYRNKI